MKKVVFAARHHRAPCKEGSQGHFDKRLTKSETTMLMNTPRFTLKPLVATISRHRFVPLYLVAMGMGAGVQAAEDDNGVPAAAAVVAPTAPLSRPTAMLEPSIQG